MKERNNKGVVYLNMPYMKINRESTKNDVKLMAKFLFYTEGRTAHSAGKRKALLNIYRKLYLTTIFSAFATLNM